MKLAIGTDHAGVDHKEAIKKLAASMDMEVLDMGTDSSESVDYPDYGEKVGLAVCRGSADMGILICGTGIGMCIAANKVRKIRAAQCYDAFTARRARQHNNANILCLGEEVGKARVPAIVETFLNTEFEGGRHQIRLDKISTMEDR